MAAADEHERRADEHARAAADAEQRIGDTSSWSCGDTVIDDQATSGGQRIITPGGGRQTPCWNLADEEVQQQRRLASREYKAAQRDRRLAGRLLDHQLASCSALTATEREHSPFVHVHSIAEVVPHREGGHVRGVWVVFDAVPGLTASWMSAAIACHRARYATFGKPGDYEAEDPTLVEGTTAYVQQRGDGKVGVLIVAETDDAGAVVLSRARALEPAARSAQR